MQSSQRPQSLRQSATGVHGLQSAVSRTSSSVQLPSLVPGNTEPSHTYAPPSAGLRSAIASNVQHPKQSQPLGVSGRHTSRHISLCAAGQVRPPTREPSNGQALPSGG